MTSTRRELTTNRMSKEQLIRTISDAARYAESQPAWMRGSRSNLRDATNLPLRQKLEKITDGKKLLMDCCLDNPGYSEFDERERPEPDEASQDSLALWTDITNTTTKDKTMKIIFKITYIEWKTVRLRGTKEYQLLSGYNNTHTKRVLAVDMEKAAYKLRESMPTQAIEIIAISEEGSIDVE